MRFVNIYYVSVRYIQSATRVCLHLIRCNLSNPIITKVYTRLYTSIYIYFSMENLFEGYDTINLIYLEFLLQYNYREYFLQHVKNNLYRNNLIASVITILRAKFHVIWNCRCPQHDLINRTRDKIFVTDCTVARFAELTLTS